MTTISLEGLEQEYCRNEVLPLYQAKDTKDSVMTGSVEYMVKDGVPTDSINNSRHQETIGTSSSSVAAGFAVKDGTKYAVKDIEGLSFVMKDPAQVPYIQAGDVDVVAYEIRDKNTLSQLKAAQVTSFAADNSFVPVAASAVAAGVSLPPPPPPPLHPQVAYMHGEEFGVSAGPPRVPAASLDLCYQPQSLGHLTNESVSYFLSRGEAAAQINSAGAGKADDGQLVYKIQVIDDVGQKL